jgi:hypothetical protein
MLLLGYFEGLDSERAIAWRAADSLSIRTFLEFDLHAGASDYSTVSRTRSESCLRLRSSTGYISFHIRLSEGNIRVFDLGTRNISSVVSSEVHPRVHPRDLFGVAVKQRRPC